MDLQIIYENQNRILNRISLTKKRYLYDSINWNLKSIGILGQRGVGKTTMMLQYIKENYKNSNKALYISLDTPYMQSVSLFDFAVTFEQNGGELLFVDEVHKYEEWASHIKSIYDFLDIQVIFSGSSLLQISKQNADLSRRSIIYHLENLSFREYLSISDIAQFDAFSLENILESHVDIASKIKETIKPLMYFKDYLKYGAYPFVIEDKENYHQRVQQMINLILETDLPSVNSIDMGQIKKLKKMLYMLAVNVPFIPNITDIATATNISRPKIYEYLHYLENAKIINSVTSKEKGYKIMSKPEKLFMQNTNISYALTSEINIGSAREAFFVNQIKNSQNSKEKFIDDTIYSSKIGDFLVENRYVFEVGGKNKSYNQIKNITNSYIAADEIEIGYGNKIPLWIFGFLY